MTNPQPPAEVASVSFQGSQLTIIKHNNGTEFVAMKPLVKALGLRWEDQYRIMTTDPVLKSTIGVIPIVAHDGKPRDMICLPLKFLNGWLFKISTSRYKNQEQRERIIRYQLECYDALYNYWHKGIAERKPEFPETLTPAQQLRLTLAVKEKAEGQSKAYAEIWGRIKRKFNVAKYEQIPSGRIDEAVAYVTNMELRVKTDDGEDRLKLRIEVLEQRLADLEKANRALPPSQDTIKAAFRNIVEIQQIALNTMYGSLAQRGLV